MYIKDLHKIILNFEAVCLNIPYNRASGNFSHSRPRKIAAAAEVVDRWQCDYGYGTPEKKLLRDRSDRHGWI
jgi:hypothetical protein